jgi:hypothetical protein
VLGIALLRRVDDLDLPRPANPIQKGTP